VTNSISRTTFTRIAGNYFRNHGSTAVRRVIKSEAGRLEDAVSAPAFERAETFVGKTAINPASSLSNQSNFFLRSHHFRKYNIYSQEN